MKVLHVIPSVASVRGGPSQAVVEMVRALRRQGVDAEIATTNDNGLDLLDVPLHQRSEYKGVPIWFFPRFSPKVHAIREFAFSSALTQWLWKSVSSYDLIHVHAIFSYASTVAMAIARHKNVPYIVRPLGQLCQWSLQQGATKKQYYLRLIERANINASAALHLTSEQEKKEVEQLGFQSPSFVLPHGLEMPQKVSDARLRLRQKLELDADEPIILFLSRLHPKKGLDYLIPALGRLSDQRFTFLLAGNGEQEYERELRDLIAEHNLTEKTHFCGFVRGEQKDLLLQGSDLFALTSHSENFGIVVLEAMSSGLPVIVTPGVALASLVQEYHLGKVVNLEIQEIEYAIRQNLENRSHLQEAGKCASILIQERYSWSGVTQRLSEYYGDKLR